MDDPQPYIVNFINRSLDRELFLKLLRLLDIQVINGILRFTGEKIEAQSFCASHA